MPFCYGWDPQNTTGCSQNHRRKSRITRNYRYPSKELGDPIGIEIPPFRMVGRDRPQTGGTRMK